MFCPRCGTDNRDHAQFCEKCGFNLPIAGAAPAPGAYAPQYAPPPNQPSYAPPYAPPYPQQAVPQADPRMRTPGSMQDTSGAAGRKYAQDKSPVVAVILSFLLSGLGQLYNGDFKKFLLIWGICIVFIIIAVATGGVASFLLLGIWVWSMVDAYRVASRTAPLM